MSAEKNLRIAVAADEASFRRAKLLVDDLTRSIEKLAKASATAGASGILGGVTTQRTQPGLGGSAQFSNKGTQRGGAGGIVGSLIGGDSSTIRTLVTTSSQAFSTVSSGIKTFVDRATADVTRLNRTLRDTKTLMGGWGGGGGSTGGAAGAAQSNPGDAAMANLIRQHDPFQKNAMMFSGNGGAAKGGGFMGGVRNWVGGRAQAAANFAGLPPGASGAIGNFAKANFMGFGLGAAAVGAWNYGANSFVDQRAGKLDYELSEPTRRLERAAAVAGIGRDSYMAGRFGDVSRVAAQRAVLGNRDVMRSIGDVTLQKEQVMLALGIGPNASGIKKRVLDSLSNAASSTFNGVMGALGAGPVEERDERSKLELQFQKAMLDTNPELAARFSSAVTATQGLQNPEWRLEANAAYQGAGANLNLRRQGLFSAPKGQDAYVYMREREARLKGIGRTNEEDAAARRAIMGGAGRGYVGAYGGIEMTGAQEGGLQGIPGLLRMGGSLGGSVGAGVGFVRNTVQGAIGAGGLDVTVGSELFGGAMSKATGTGQFGGNGTAAAYAEGLAAMVGGGPEGGFDTAQQQRRLGMITAGESSFNSFTQGRKAPLYQATSLMGAIGAMGSYGSGAESLIKMDTGLLRTIANGGPVPEWAKGQGIGKEEANKYLNYSARVPFFETVDEYQQGPAADLLKKVRAAEGRGGSFKDVFAGHSKKEQQAMAEQLGALIPGETPEAGAGILLSMMSEGKLKGKGAHSVGAQGSIETEAQRDQASALKETVGTLKEIAAAAKIIFNMKDAREGGKVEVKATTVNKDMETATGQVAAQLNILAKNVAIVNEKFAKMGRAQ